MDYSKGYWTEGAIAPKTNTVGNGRFIPGASAPTPTPTPTPVATPVPTQTVKRTPGLLQNAQAEMEVVLAIMAVEVLAPKA